MSATAVPISSAGPRRRSHPLLNYALRRVGLGMLSLLVASMLIFVATEVLPGDPAKAVLGRDASPAALAHLRQELGLQQSIPARYVRWLGHFVQGDLGRSASSIAKSSGAADVGSIISKPLENSLILAGVTAVALVVLSVLLGTWLAMRAGRAADHVVSGALLTVVSLPEFVVGTLFAVVFAAWLKWLPALTLLNPGQSVLSAPKALILPMITLLGATLAQSVRMVRAGVIEAMRSQYVAAARLGGVSERRITYQHALRNALPPAIQVLTLNIQYLFGGIVVTEAVFNYPGLGSLLVQSVSIRDVTLVQSVALLIAVGYVGLNIIADLLVIVLVPKLRYGQ